MSAQMPGPVGEGQPGGGCARFSSSASRKSLVKLRISSRNLQIETGRYDKIARDERLCSLCNRNKIEDETHFLLDCPSYSSIRDRFFLK